MCDRADSDRLGDCASVQRLGAKRSGAETTFLTAVVIAATLSGACESNVETTDKTPPPPQGDLQPITEIRLNGIRATVDFDNDADLLAWATGWDDISKSDVPASMPATTRPAMLRGVGVTDVVWGTSLDNLAGQWFDPFGPTGAPDQVRPAVAASGFPHDCWLMCITKDFAWTGSGNSAVEVRLRTDQRHVEYWTDLQELWWLFGFSNQPEETFRHAFEKAGQTIDVRHGVATPWGVGTRYAVQTGPNPKFDTKLWTFADEFRERGVWVLALMDHADRTTLIWRMSYLVSWDSKRVLPDKSRDFPSVHHDVDGIKAVGIRDYTDLGDWGHSNVSHEGSRDALDLLDHLREGRWRLMFSALCFLGVLHFLFRQSQPDRRSA